MEDVAEEDGILELEIPSSQILEEMAYDRLEMMTNVDQKVFMFVKLHNVIRC